MAQRRRRVFVVASAREGFDPTAVLFEREGVRRDTAPSREAGTVVAALTANGVGTCGADDNQGQAGFRMVAFGEYADDETASTMKARDYKDATDLAVAYSVSLRGREGGATAELGDEVAGCLRASSGGGDKPHVLTQYGTELAGTLTARHDSSPCADRGQNMVVSHHLAVRRLMPVECERLQGFPDNHTQVPYRGKPASDGPRYKALGNSMAVCCMEWIGRRIVEQLGRL